MFCALKFIGVTGIVEHYHFRTLKSRSSRTPRRDPSVPVELVSLLKSPIIRPIIEYGLWALGFSIVSIFHLQGFYYIALLAVFLNDLRDISEKKKGLFRDFVAGLITGFLGWGFGDDLSRVLGFVLAFFALLGLVDPIVRRIDRWLS